MTTPARLLLADDEHLIRGALAALLSLADDLVRAQGPSPYSICRCPEPTV